MLTKANTIHLSRVNFNTAGRNTVVCLTLSRCVSLPCKGCTTNDMGPGGPRKISEHSFISSHPNPVLELKLTRTPVLCIYGTYSFLKNYKSARLEHHIHDNPSPLGKCWDPTQITITTTEQHKSLFFVCFYWFGALYLFPLVVQDILEVVSDTILEKEKLSLCFIRLLAQSRLMVGRPCGPAPAVETEYKPHRWSSVLCGGWWWLSH